MEVKTKSRQVYNGQYRNKKRRIGSKPQKMDYSLDREIELKQSDEYGSQQPEVAPISEQEQNQAESTAVTKQETWSLCRVMLVNSVMAGMQFCFATYCVMTVPFLEKSIGITPYWSGIIMLAGPICGFLVQPIVGNFSDRCMSKMGRRRPYIIAGGCLTFVCQIIIGTAKLMGDTLKNPESGKVLSTVMAVIGIILINITLNVMLGSIRALIADIVPEKSQNAGATYSGFMVGLSFLICNLIIFLIAHFAYGSGEGVVDEAKLYADVYPIVSPIASVVEIVFMLPTVLLCKEVPLAEKPKTSNPFVQLFREIYYLPGIFWRMCGAILFGWAAYYPLQSFMGTIYTLETTLIAAMVCNLVTTLVCPLYSKIIDKVGERTIYIIAAFLSLTATVILFSGSMLDSEKQSKAKEVLMSTYMVAICMIFIGFINAAQNTIPFTLLGKRADDRVKGLYAGIFNCVIVIGQALASLTMTIANSANPPKSPSNNNALWVSMIYGVISVIMMFFIKNASSIKKEDCTVENLRKLAAEKKQRRLLKKKGVVVDEYCFNPEDESTAEADALLEKGATFE